MLLFWVMPNRRTREEWFMAALYEATISAAKRRKGDVGGDGWMQTSFALNGASGIACWTGE
jgi:hypothetical protein